MGLTGHSFAVMEIMITYIVVAQLSHILSYSYLITIVVSREAEG